jgi:hypothetical protein
MNKKIYEELDQYDHGDDQYIQKKIDEYSFLIGSFLISFSQLEHELNLAIAETFADDLVEYGYMIIEDFTFANKIRFFYKIYNLRET